MADKEVVILFRDTTAMLVPSGAPVMLPKGTEVTITQSLGDTFTINIYGNLARIDAKDADALGKQVKSPLDDLPQNATLEDKVWAQLHTVFDPEIPVNIVDLGLIYNCKIEKLADETQHVMIDMTLTAPGCGMGPIIAEDVKRKVLAIAEVSQADIQIVFDPPWDRERMSDTAKLQLGLL
jgi:probable FeS assembly SUF system protein SufT